MSKIEVLVACMHQKDDSLYSDMNLCTDAVFANQCDEYGYCEFTESDGCRVRLVSTADRGVGKNRNKALMFSEGEYLLFSDHDVIYVDDYPKIVEKAFSDSPKADMIVFGLEYLSQLMPVKEHRTKQKKLHVWNSMRYGAPQIAIRRGALEKNCLTFSTMYGGGAKYSAGEDSLFIREAFRKGLKIYVSPAIIARVKQEESTWFFGYNDKYFIDNGILIANAFPIMKNLFVYYFAFGKRNVSKDYSFFKICKLMKQGFKVYKEI